jgi:hypothetical protein
MHTTAITNSRPQAGALIMGNCAVPPMNAKCTTRQLAEAVMAMSVKRALPISRVYFSLMMKYTA